MKGANRHMKSLLVVFREQHAFGALWSFYPFFTKHQYATRSVNDR